MQLYVEGAGGTLSSGRCRSASRLPGTTHDGLSFDLLFQGPEAWSWFVDALSR